MCTFKDLGLLIIDEEQRFGVRHKERLKQLRSEVDVLTLTATPIPRTLYMALSGVRDMSTIDTPPEERLPIRTQVARVRRDADPRAPSCASWTAAARSTSCTTGCRASGRSRSDLQKLVPEARMAIGHGQMPEDELAQGHDGLCGGQVRRAGLHLHHRERPGHPQRQHHHHQPRRPVRPGPALPAARPRRAQRGAGLCLPAARHAPCGCREVARKRVWRPSCEASELGAGFRIAMRDLEIRGAGDILGARQHGHIAAIGFELYTRLLAQAVEELKEKGLKAGGCSPEIELPPVIELPLQAYLPDDYVPDEDLRIRLYQRMTSLRAKTSWTTCARNWRTASASCRRTPRICSTCCACACSLRGPACGRWAGGQQPGAQAQRSRRRRGPPGLWPSLAVAPGWGAGRCGSPWVRSRVTGATCWLPCYCNWE